MAGWMGFVVRPSPLEVLLLLPLLLLLLLLHLLLLLVPLLLLASEWQGKDA